MIYFITCREVQRVKIGFSEEPRGRFIKMRTDSPLDLVLERICEGDMADERALHSRFADDRLNGEWFTLSPAIEAHMETLSRHEPKKRDLSIHQMITRATGCVPGYASQMLSPKYGQRVTIPIAIAVYREFGVLIGPIEGAEPHEVDTLEKFCGRFEKKGAAA